MKIKLRKSWLIVLGITICYLGCLLYPNFLFSYYHSYENFHIYSDRPIPAKIERVLDRALQRMKGSSLYREEQQFRIYFCNSEWRFIFFTRNRMAGGLVNFLISPNIFMRESNINENQLIPPGPWKNPLHNRPLSYFIAHEATHSMQRADDPLLQVKVPSFIIEGYADYIAKGNTQSLASLIQDYHQQKPSMDPSNNLYDLYHLYIRYLIEKEGFDYIAILEQQPSLEQVLQKIDRVKF